MTKGSKAEGDKLVHLEAARGIASLVVLLHHFSLAFAQRIKNPFPNGLVGTPLYWIGNGDAAVDLFFVLSGFVLTRRYFDRGVSGIELATAAVKRLPRLIVPAGAAILLSWLLLELNLTWHVDAGRLTHNAWLSAYANAAFPPGFQPSLHGAVAQSVTVFFFRNVGGYYDSNLWTMRPEFLGSLFCFALVWLLAAGRARSVVGMLLAASAALILAHLVGPLILPFLLGTIIARLFRPGALVLSLASGSCLVVLGLLLCSSTRFDLNVLGSTVLILALLSSPVLAAGLSNRAGLWIGRYSFPIYLVHPMVISSISSGTYVVLAQLGWAKPFVVAAVAVVTLGTTFAAALPFAALEGWWVPTLNRLAKHVAARADRKTLNLRTASR